MHTGGAENLAFDIVVRLLIDDGVHSRATDEIS
jgi:hypothetical protein